MTPTLPRCCVITPEPASASTADCHAFLDTLSAVLARGETLVQLRVKSFDAAAFARLAADALARCDAAGAQLMLNGPIDAAGVMRLDGAGWHLDGAALRAVAQRPLPAARRMSAACHAADDLVLAARAGVDFVTLSPVLPTLSHPGAPTLGWTQFAALAAQAAMPVYALGGMTRAHLDDARRHGAYGVAGIRGFW
ncbi:MULTISPECIES: thiamine phosphate synthase [unclassified Burkholderia]|uniref:thiamine phosphate synthase n=1 Tax=unclassified Burkholderia TaxID=2613784 RepID=UPI000F5767AD|nr:MULTISPECIES: thiamine phosphate synthase [unclassified Burkholderia]RQR37168.1 thiamine phosphate synthase [Burkholderia sp. Bp9131]RQR68148.1 thiamine phosphate synthase [Burkholderia sp. Bp9015]RQR84118.1 thiamine phosphate synthase [Burkholderia sp. Bp9011]RQR91568.1 thiamine phosphate synthase [Burkholderia sp. Bp8994]RQR94326.1 thiamine phosphate synthase [Burkholderia sp. Bp9010]